MHTQSQEPYCRSSPNKDHQPTYLLTVLDDLFLVKLLVDTLDRGESLTSVSLLDSDVDQLVSPATHGTAQLPVRERI